MRRPSRRGRLITASASIASPGATRSRPPSKTTGWRPVTISIPRSASSSGHLLADRRPKSSSGASSGLPRSGARVRSRTWPARRRRTAPAHRAAGAQLRPPGMVKTRSRRIPARSRRTTRRAAFVGHAPEGDRTRDRPEHPHPGGDQEEVVGDPLAVADRRDGGYRIDRDDAADVEADAASPRQRFDVVAKDAGGAVGLADGEGAEDELAAGRAISTSTPSPTRSRSASAASSPAMPPPAINRGAACGSQHARATIARFEFHRGTAALDLRLFPDDGATAPTPQCDRRDLPAASSPSAQPAAMPPAETPPPEGAGAGAGAGAGSGAGSASGTLPGVGSCSPPSSFSPGFSSSASSSSYSYSYSRSRRTSRRLVAVEAGELGQAGRHREFGAVAGNGRFHEGAPDRPRGRAAVAGRFARLRVADPDRGRVERRVADEPGVGDVLRGARLARRVGAAHVGVAGAGALR